MPGTNREENNEVLRNITGQLMENAADTTIWTAMALLADIPEREELPMAANAMNCFCVTLASEIGGGRGNKDDDSEAKRSGGAAIHLCAQTLNDIATWARAHPEEAEALDTEISRFMAELMVQEENFTSRKAVDNFTAVQVARTYEDALAEGMTGPPKRCADGLLVLARHARRLEEKLREASLSETFMHDGEIYDGDRHFDAYQTRLWASTLARTAQAQ